MEAILITKHHKRGAAYIQIGNHTVTSELAIKYLGVMVDKQHVQNIYGKASTLSIVLERMMANMRRPRYTSRLLTVRVVIMTRSM